MSDASEFGIDRQAVVDLADSLGNAGAGSLEDAFPAALLAATWRALLENGGIEAPAWVDLDRVEVLLAGPKVLELRVPVRTADADLVKVVPVSVEKWSASGQLVGQLADEAERLVEALKWADMQQPFDHYIGQGQKPHN